MKYKYDNLAKVLEIILDSKDSVKSIILDDVDKSVKFTFTAGVFEAIHALKHTQTETIKEQKEKEAEFRKIQVDNFDKNASIEEKMKVLKNNIKNIVNAPRVEEFLFPKEAEAENAKAQEKQEKKKMQR